MLSAMRTMQAAGLRPQSLRTQMVVRLKSTYGISGEGYVVPPEAKKQFFEKGYCVLPKFLTEEELKFIDECYGKFMRREVPVPGKDFCDMSKPFSTPFEQYSIINAMLPTKYLPALNNNIYERRAAHAVAQLYPDVPVIPGFPDMRANPLMINANAHGSGMVKDYDQLLDKNPNKPDAVFAWHQDMAYWPGTPDTRTATFSLALDSTSIANGALKFIPGSQKDKTVRPHKPVGATRDDAHAIAIAVDESKENVQYVEINRGDVSIHDEWVVHGSGGNRTSGHRRTYVLAFRTADTVRRERAAGFTHSHNDSVNWDSFNQWQEDSTGKKAATV